MNKIKIFIRKHKIISFLVMFVAFLVLFNQSFAMYNEYRVAQAYEKYEIDYNNIIYLADIQGTDGEYIIFKDEYNKYKVLEIGRINIFIGGLNTGENNLEDITEIMESNQLYFHKAEGLGRIQWYAIGVGQYEVYNIPNANNDVINEINHFEGADGILYTEFMFEGIQPKQLDYSKIK